MTTKGWLETSEPIGKSAYDHLMFLLSIFYQKYHSRADLAFGYKYIIWSEAIWLNHLVSRGSKCAATVLISNAAVRSECGEIRAVLFDFTMSHFE